MLTKLFNKASEKTPIKMTGSFRLNKDQKLVVQEEEIQQLLQHNECCNDIRDNKKYKVLRFLLRTNGELVFAHEGTPYGIVPAHWQMAGVAHPSHAECVTAGNAYFNMEDNTLELINHKSGDFRPSFDSLQFVFPQLIEACIKMSDTLEIEQLNTSGCRLNKYQIKYREILEYCNSEIPKNDEAIETNEETDSSLSIGDSRQDDTEVNLEAFNQNSLPSSSLVIEEDSDSSEGILLQPQSLKTAKESFIERNKAFLQTKKSYNEPSLIQTFFGINNTQKWQDKAKQLRLDALDTLTESLNLLLCDDDKLDLIDYALTLPLFNQHRSNYWITGAFGNTDAMTILQDLKAEFAENESSCFCF